MNNRRRNIIIVLVIFMLISGLFLKRSRIRDVWLESQRKPVPSAQNFTEIKSENININNDTNVNNDVVIEEDEIVVGEEEAQVEVLDSINLNIPFQSQAPHANWDMPYQEGCEEASVILSVAYLRGQTSLTADEMNEKMLALVDWQNQNWGGHHDLTAKQTATMIEEFYKNEFETELIYDFTWDDVKQALSAGYPVIAPTAGRQLSNPYYTAPGPLYHMLVIKGYTDSVMITNDVGTRRGADYQYSYDTLYNAIHDWNDGDVPNGQKAIIILKPSI